MFFRFYWSKAKQKQVLGSIIHSAVAVALHHGVGAAFLQGHPSYILQLEREACAGRGACLRLSVLAGVVQAFTRSGLSLAAYAGF